MCQGKDACVKMSACRCLLHFSSCGSSSVSDDSQRHKQMFGCTAIKKMRGN